MARTLRLPALVITFHPHPRQLLSQQISVLTLERKVELFRAAGATWSWFSLLPARLQGLIPGVYPGCVVLCPELPARRRRGTTIPSAGAGQGHKLNEGHGRPAGNWLRNCPAGDQRRRGYKQHCSAQILKPGRCGNLRPGCIRAAYYAPVRPGGSRCSAGGSSWAFPTANLYPARLLPCRPLASMQLRWELRAGNTGELPHRPPPHLSGTTPGPGDPYPGVFRQPVRPLPDSALLLKNCGMK